MMKMLMDADKAFQPSDELMRAIGTFTEEIAKSGRLVQTGGMASSAKVTRVRASGGKLTVTDGPFAEAKEQVGGYAIIEVGSREEAIELGRQFMEIHLKIVGPSFLADSEIQEMFPMPVEVRK
ncbi:MAG: YciI family protein [Spirochaetia bacterium]